VNPPLLELDDITFRYPGRQDAVFQGLSFVLGEERIGLVGPNGSGKTTLLHLMVGLLRPESGSIRFQGTLVQTERDFRPLRRRIGFLFQNVDDQLFSPTVLEDVTFGPLNLGLSHARAVSVAEEVLEQVGLAGYGPRVTHRLSGGEKRLVALATVLAMKPKALLLDEPTNDLDPHSRRRLISILAGLDLAGIIISHDWDFLDRLATRFCAFDHGRLIPCDSPILHEHKHIHPLGDHDHSHSSDEL